ncbi:NAD(P)-dependent oxidoreductase [Balneatrix alpica]|uniref:NAD(P)-dependent oxidoreductase n=1 Tax=Balneatrix alpica TaxID=75684 RepID=UPI0027399262|nr:NAD(P)-dependent oxidoreductase [Balneatrix alpica]
MQIGFHSQAFYLGDWQQAWQARCPSWPLVDAQQVPIQTLEALLIWRPSQWDWRAAKQLKLVIGLGAGIHNLQQDLLLPPGVPLLRLQDAGMARAMCEYVHYGVLHFQRQFDRFARAQQQNRWLTELPYQYSQHTRVGLLGLGHLGTAVAEYLAKQGYQVSGWSRSPRQLAGVHCLHGQEQLEYFLSQQDILVNMLPHTAQTEGLLSRQRLQQLPRGAALISASRGAVLEQQALIGLLDSGQLRGALLDVFTQEPLAEADPLWRHPRVWITPHHSAPTLIEPAIDEILAILPRYLSGTS